MATSVGQMTKNEFQALLEHVIEEKLVEILGDPDEALRLKKAARDRLIRQRRAVANGERGELLDETVQRLGL